MTESGRTFIKLCGFVSPDDILRACELDIDAVGIVLASDARTALGSEEVGALLRATEGSHVKRVAVVGALPPASAQAVLDLGFDALQWVLRAPCGPSWHGRDVIPVFFDGDDVQQRLEALLDPSEWTGTTITQTICIDGPSGGGRGQRADWDRAARLASTFPLLLAGGLKPGNVATALARVKPRGVDVSSGIELPSGRKDPQAMADFVATVRAVC